MTRGAAEHCWKDVIPASVLALYAHYSRGSRVGPSPALLAIDLYELAYQGGPRPLAEVTKAHPSSCGEYAWAAIAPTRRLLAAARAAGLPVFYSTSDPRGMRATRRRGASIDPRDYAIRAEFAPRPGDTVIHKSRASAFFGTPLAAHLTGLGVQSLIVCGQSTSGCVRASAVDAYSHGFKVALAEECCFDRNPISHKVNLFDLHHKYADVLPVERIVAQLRARRARPRRGR